VVGMEAHLGAMVPVEAVTLAIKNVFDTACHQYQVRCLCCPPLAGLSLCYEKGDLVRDML